MQSWSRLPQVLAEQSGGLGTEPVGRVQHAPPASATIVADLPRGERLRFHFVYVVEHGETITY
jgi:hypothetical protein